MDFSATAWCPGGFLSENGGQRANCCCTYNIIHIYKWNLDVYFLHVHDHVWFLDLFNWFTFRYIDLILHFGGRDGVEFWVKRKFQLAINFKMILRLSYIRWLEKKKQKTYSPYGGLVVICHGPVESKKSPQTRVLKKITKSHLSQRCSVLASPAGWLYFFWNRPGPTGNLFWGPTHHGLILIKNINLLPINP